MPSPLYLTIKKPVAFYEKNLSADLKGVFKSLTKAAGHIAGAKFADLIGDAGELLTAIGLKADTTELCWVLIRRSLVRAMLSIAFELNLPLGKLPKNISDLANEADAALSNVEIEISPRLFKNPRHMSVITEIQPYFGKWLITAGVLEVDAASAVRRLPSYFVFSVAETMGFTAFL